MSGRLVGAVLADRLDDAGARERAGLRAVMVVLAEAAGPEGIAWPSRATIADRALLSPRQVVRILARLEALGRLYAVSDRAGGRGRSTRWAITPQPAVKGDTTSPYGHPVKGDTTTVKGDTQVSPEPTDRTFTPPTPPPSGGDESPGMRDTPETLPAVVTLPGTGPEVDAGVPVIGGRRARGDALRDRGQAPRQRAAAERAARREAERAARFAARDRERAAAVTSSDDVLAALDGTTVGAMVRRRLAARAG